MNNFENIDLTYYGEDINFTKNKEYHAMQEKLKKYFQFIVDTIVNRELEKKSPEINDFMADLNDVVENISSVKVFDGKASKIIISDRYIVFDYFKETEEKVQRKRVIIDKKINEFNFMLYDDGFIRMSSYNFSNEGIQKRRFYFVEPIYMLNDETIAESISEIKDENRKRGIAV